MVMPIADGWVRDSQQKVGGGLIGGAKSGAVHEEQKQPPQHAGTLQDGPGDGLPLLRLPVVSHSTNPPSGPFTTESQHLPQQQRFDLFLGPLSVLVHGTAK